MKVTECTPCETKYSIEDLTLDELTLIKNILGKASGEISSAGLYYKLNDALDDIIRSKSYVFPYKVVLEGKLSVDLI